MYFAKCKIFFLGNKESKTGLLPLFYKTPVFHAFHNMEELKEEEKRKNSLKKPCCNSPLIQKSPIF